MTPPTIITIDAHIRSMRLPRRERDDLIAMCVRPAESSREGRALGVIFAVIVAAGRARPEHHPAYRTLVLMLIARALSAAHDLSDVYRCYANASMHNRMMGLTALSADPLLWTRDGVIHAVDDLLNHT